jgi:hypothetical protein
VKNGNNTIVRVYLMLYCPLETLTKEKLEAFVIELEDKSKSVVEFNKFHGKGSSYHPPYFAVELGIKQSEYDYDQLISNINNLFDAIKVNRNRIRELLLLDGVRATFAIIFNCQNADQKPAFDLNNEQLKMLSDIGASLCLDTYLEF